MDSVKIREYNAMQIPLNVGDHPRVGQEWTLNQPIQLGSSNFVVDSVTFLGNGYTFHLSSEDLPEGVTPNIDFVDSASNSFYFENINSTVDTTGGKTIATITLTSQSTPPTGKLTVNWWMEEYIPQPGPWSLVWTPPKTDP